MAEKSKIGWTDATQNFWRGCAKISEGCKFCYMFRDLARYGQDGSQYIRASKATFEAPLKWKEPRKIFTCSLSDFFIESADADRVDAWDVIRKTPQHTWLILTKRPERIIQCLPSDWEKGWDNVWLGITTENQFRLAERLPLIAGIPTAKKFLSIEPILSEINLLDKYLEPYISKIDWIIVGGESGNDTGKHRYRESKLEWYYQIVKQSKELKIPVFVKQLGTHLAKELGFKDRVAENLETLPAINIKEFP